MDKGRELEESKRAAVLGAEVAELARTKLELHAAKENAMQSWLDSRPLIDELEMQKSNLADAKKRLDASVIPELESQLEIINNNIRSKREYQFKAETMSHEINQTLDRTRYELEGLEFDIKKERQSQVKLRQILHLRRLKLQTLHLTLQAILLESDAREKSADEALHRIKQFEVHTAAVQLTHQEYSALTRADEERLSQANQKVSVSREKKLAAEARRDSALSRLNKLNPSRSSKMDRRNKTGQREAETNVEKNDSRENVVAINNKTGASSEAQTKSLVKKPQQSRRSRSNIKKQEKPSIVHRIKRCFGLKIRKSGG
ncbi:hypothetical protein K1719_029294 [Acacia pycnantha]|nr:hypothetical protein K1719_029294 [Acacia pycnantha]